MEIEEKIIPVRDIWYKPRKTMRYILDGNYNWIFYSSMVFLIPSIVLSIMIKNYDGASGNKLISNIQLTIIFSMVVFICYYIVLPYSHKVTGFFDKSKNNISEIKCFLGVSAYLYSIYFIFKVIGIVCEYNSYYSNFLNILKIVGITYIIILYSETQKIRLTDAAASYVVSSAVIMATIWLSIYIVIDPMHLFFEWLIG